ncbi:hypothetical protein G7046_g9808 [Stylonectria norvegica]|nr:hypothetical protein G7046_g9808 [Stylonectria norvegica]
MHDDMKAKYEAQAQDLRLDLKAWESEWAKTHEGKKPGRDDIKANPDIVQKYKQYQIARDILSGKLSPPPVKEDLKLKKRKPDPIPSSTPNKRNRHTKDTETPSKDRNYDEELMNTPAISRKLFSPAPITSLGPTPQRDGRVLGLFDLLVEKELGTTPRKSGSTAASRNKVQSTPSKRAIRMDEETVTRLGRTPMSASKRQMLNSFMTPLKNRDKNATSMTPTSVSKLQFDTPQFLKRHSLPALDENELFDAPAPLKLPRKPLVRGLSEIVASLRKVEEDALDDEMDALREAEGEEMGESAPKSSFQSKDDILVADSQIQQLPLGGFDEEGLYDGVVGGNEGVDQRGNPLRVFKKKGQKRTTRRSNMRPTRTKRPSEDDPLQDNNDENEDAIPETQNGVHEEGSDGDFDASKAKKPAAKTAKKDGTVKKAAKKVNELAHANFQKLKLKNNGLKGGPGFNSKFRRRR